MPSNKKKSLKKKSITKDEVVLAPDALRYLRYRVSDSYNTERHLFLKKDLSKDNSLIVTNIPAFIKEEVVLAFIKQFAPFEVEESFVQRSSAADSSFWQGQITISVSFVNSEAVDHVLGHCQSAGPFVATDFSEESEFPSILNDSILLYRKLFPDEDQIEELAQTYVERCDTEQAEARQAAKRKHSEPDEDGWVTVTKYSKKVAKPQKLRRDEVPLSGGLNNKKRKVDLAFYTFQVNKDKHQKAQELLKKFEDDKKRIAQLKQSRNFKPL